MMLPVISQPQPMPAAHPRVRERASVLIFTLFVVTILSVAVASTLMIASNKYHTVFQASSWQEAFYGAEAGADLAVAAITGNNWANWYVASGTPPRTTPTTNTSTASGVPSSGNYNYTVVDLSHGGEGNNRLSLFVTVDAPASLSPAGGSPWLRVRATGITDVSGPTQVSLEKRDAALRKLSLVTDRDTGKAVTRPFASRTVELILKPQSRGRAITLKGTLQMPGGNGLIDSFDSSDPTKSTNGLYARLKAQKNGDVGMMNSTGSDLQGSTINGNLFYNPTPPIGIQHVNGTMSGGFNATIDAVPGPPANWAPTNTSVTIIQTTTTLVSGTKANPARYRVSQITFGSGTTITIRLRRAAARATSRSSWMATSPATATARSSSGPESIPRIT